MNFISKISRFILRQFHAVFYFLRIIKLKLLYPGINIDFKTRVESNCSMVCIKGGKLIISNSKISFGTNIIADAGGTLSIDQSFIGRNCVITAKEKVIINKNCLVAEMVVIGDQDHITAVLNGEHKREEFETAPVEIEEK
jgi:acetyltransferase-like isoleucine patch superfamily enzyme